MKAEPDAWAVATVGEINSFQSAQLDPSRFPEERFELYSVPAFPSGHPELVAGSQVGSTKQLVEPSDVLVCKINPRINRVWIVRPNSGLKQIASSEWIVVRAPGFDPKYLRGYFSSPSFREEICTEVSGVGGSLTRAQPKRVAELGIPVSPRREQQRIADKLEAVLGRVDACRDHLDRVGSLLTRFRQSVLQAATSGALTDSWRQLHGERPWLESTLGELGLVSGGLTKNSRREALATRYRYLRVANVYANRLELADVSDIGATEAEFRRTRLEDGDLLIVEGNGSIEQVGRVAMWRGALPDCSHQNHLIRWRAGPDALAAYLLYWLMSPVGRTALMARASSSSGLHTLSIGKVGSIAISIPSVAEQAAVVAEVQRLLVLADRLDARLRTAQRFADRLTPSVLAKAFRGELVPQDPADEPAQALLDRLRAARASEPPGRRRRQRVGD